MPVSKKPRKTRNATHPSFQDDEVIMQRGWDEINDLSVQCQRYAQTAMITKPVIDHLKSLPKEEVDKEAFMSIASISNNLNGLIERLNGLTRKHKGKTGDANMEDYIEVINLGQEYQRWISDYDSIIMPHVAVLTGYMAEVGISKGENINV